MRTKNRVAQIELKSCDQCPYAKVSKVYTEDSWDDVRKIRCSQLGKDVYSYLHWHDKAPVPHECPFGVEKS